MQRIRRLDEKSLNSSSSDTSSRTPSKSAMTMNDSSLQSSGILLMVFMRIIRVPSSERIVLVELQSDIHEKLGELMIHRSPEDVMAAAEALHAESDKYPFSGSKVQFFQVWCALV